MHIARSILLLVTGATSGIALILSCGDNLKSSADAAVDAPKASDAAPNCDCPAAEPPLAGRFVRFHKTQIIGPNDFHTQSAGCPAGAQLISGSCTQDEINPYRRLTLEQSGFYKEGPNEWFCFFRNNEPRDVTIRVSVTCLLPPP
jgi:hypothetical protein